MGKETFEYIEPEEQVEGVFYHYYEDNLLREILHL